MLPLFVAMLPTSVERKLKRKSCKNFFFLHLIYAIFFPFILAKALLEKINSIFVSHFIADLICRYSVDICCLYIIFLWLNVLQIKVNYIKFVFFCFYFIEFYNKGHTFSFSYSEKKAWQVLCL